jgi:hypothetical protein
MVTTRTGAVERALAAEVRAMEDGHQARWSTADRCFTVVSESEPGASRRVYVEARVFSDRRAVLVFSCDCPAGEFGRQSPAGLFACKHSARVAQRLERERLARFDRTTTRWIATGNLLAAALEDADRNPAPVRNDPPATVSGPGHKAHVPTETNAERLRRMLQAGWD